MASDFDATTPSATCSTRRGRGALPFQQGGPVPALLGAVVVLLGCRSQAGAPETAPTSGSGAAAPLVGADPAVPSGTSGALEITPLGPGRFALRSAGSLELSASARIERRTTAGAYEPVALAGGFRLSEVCDTGGSPASDCITLGAGETRVPGAWNGGACAGPCCPSGAPQSAPSEGVYRLVASGCGARGGQWVSPDFTLPLSINALYRARAAAQLEVATVARLHALDVVEDIAESEQRIAGFAVESGSEVALAGDRVAALARWLTGDGFDDRVVRRCKRAEAYGFRAVRKLPGGGDERTEIAVDFNCNSVAVVHDESGKSLRSDAFFDASREALIELVKSAMPGALGRASTR